MKKRILLSLVSFFAMTAMWASLTEAYQIVPVGTTVKAGETATITLNLKNKNAINLWAAELVLPEGVTYVEGSFSAVATRVPAGYTPVLSAAATATGVQLSFSAEEGTAIALTGTNDDSAIATIQVQVASDVTPGDYTITVKNAVLAEPADDDAVAATHNYAEKGATLTVEEGAAVLTGDLNGDGKVDIADAVTVLNIMAAGEYSADADLNEDGKVDIADFVTVLNIMAAQ